MHLRTFLALSLVVFTVAEDKDDCKSPKTGSYCYGLGEYTVGTEVYDVKCPQLNLTDTNNVPNKVVSRHCMKGGKVAEGKDCFAVTTAVWDPLEITGIGLEGYWTNFQSSKDKELYGWVDGVLPAKTINNSIVQIGMEVLCRDPKITGVNSFPNGTAPCNASNTENQKHGCWMEGQIVNPSINEQWVCKLTDLSREILPFVSHANIIPLCFAKSRDYNLGRRLNITKESKTAMASVHSVFGNDGGDDNCDCTSDACATCCPWCSIAIEPSGFQCPNSVTLAMKVLHYDISKGSDHLYHKGQVTGMYFTDPKMDVLHYQVDYKEVQPTWGPQPGTSDYIIPYINANDIDPVTSFGKLVLCPHNCTDPTGSTCEEYEAGTIYNTPMQTKAKDGQYHLYGCENQDFNLPPKLCQPNQMLTLCWPKML